MIVTLAAVQTLIAVPASAARLCLPCGYREQNRQIGKEF
jgi:hypothetical protein